MKQPQESRKVRYTRMVLKDSLTELMVQKPLSKITIKEICQNADINRTTFYAHFTDQYQLLRSIEQDALAWAGDRLAQLSQNKTREALYKNIQLIFQAISEDKNHVQILLSDQGDLGFQEQLIHLILRECGVLPDAEPPKGSCEQELYYLFIVNGSVGLIRHWLKNGLHPSPGKMADSLLNITYPLITLLQ